MSNLEIKPDINEDGEVRHPNIHDSHLVAIKSDDDV